MWPICAPTGSARAVRRKGDAFELRIGRRESDAIRGAAGQVRALIVGDADDPLLGRLFPPAYNQAADAERETDYRSLMHDELVQRRLANLDALVGALDAERLTRDELEAFMGAVNDVRLVLGTRLDVREDDAPWTGMTGPDAGLRALYAYLSWLLDQAVSAAMDG